MTTNKAFQGQNSDRSNSTWTSTLHHSGVVKPK